MKIAMVSEHADPLADIAGPDCGGQNVHVAELSRALACRGHDVVVFTRRDCDGPDERRSESGYRVVRLPCGPPEPIPKDAIYQHLGEFTDALTTSLVAERPNVVHAHFWMSAVATELAAFPLRIPTVLTYHALGSVKRRHQGASDTSPSQRIAIERVVGRHANAIAATCTDEVAELHAMGISTHNVCVIPCGVNTIEFAHPGESQIEPWRRQRFRIVAVGRLVPRKGFDTVITALTDVPDTELVIVGGPATGSLDCDPEARRLIARAGQAGVSDRVRFTGAVPRGVMPAVMRSADVVTCTPWYEPFGIVPLEAMAAGVPVIVSAVGGMLDTVVPGITGERVPPRDPAALAAALQSLLSDPNLRKCYGRAGRRRVERHFDWARVARRTESLYRHVLTAEGTNDTINRVKACREAVFHGDL